MAKDEKKQKKEDKEPDKKPLKNPWKSISIASVILSVILIGVIATDVSCGGVTGMATADADSVGEKAVDFIKENMVAKGTEVTVSEIEEQSGLYKLVLQIEAQGMAREVESYLTKDGNLFFPQVVNITEMEEIVQEAEEPEGTGAEGTEVPKTDKPEAHAFVMSYCPYGLQFMKAYVPVVELLGEKADLELNFVDYAMHGKKELDENMRLYCIQKKQEEKFTDYVRCFVEEDDYEKCIEDTGVDLSALESCIESTDEEFNVTGLYEDNSTWSNGMFPQFPVETGMNDEYGVGGSPTFVLNGKVVQVGRSPEAIKEAVCSAFNEPPEECEQELSTQSEQPGIGPIGSGDGSASEGQC